MPKVDIDYSNTIFYKISCKNPEISDVYIGHTTNFVQRKYAHKQACLHKGSNHNCKLYKVMRDNDGWNNWNMEIIAFHACDDHYSARIQEQKYFEEFNATLNSVEPFPKIKPKPLPKPKIKQEKIIRRCVNTHNSLKICKKFYCEKCDYTCNKQSEFTKHTNSKKHNTIITTEIQYENSPYYICICGKKYNHRGSLFNHKKGCTYEPPSNENSQEIQNTNENEIDYKNMFLELMKQNQELQKAVVQQQYTINQLIPQIGNMNKNTAEIGTDL